jgi:hypothetical protein
MHVPASLPASMNGLLGGMAPMPGQRQLLLRQQILAGASFTAGSCGLSRANSSTALNHLNLPIAATNFPADQTAVPAYLAAAAAGSAAALGGTSSDEMLLLMQQQMLGQAQGGFNSTDLGPGAQQLQDFMLLDPCGFNAAGLSALQGMPVGPTDCMLPGGFGEGGMGASDAAGGSGSLKGDKQGVHAPHNPLYKVSMMLRLCDVVLQSRLIVRSMLCSLPNNSYPCFAAPRADPAPDLLTHSFFSFLVSAD